MTHPTKTIMGDDKNVIMLIVRFLSVKLLEILYQ